MDYHRSDLRRDEVALRDALQEVFPESRCYAANAAISTWPGYEPTPLVWLGRLATQLGVGNIAIKDESKRFGLKSFKALGGAYAVDTLVTGAVSPMTVVTATDGNHGRSVAWGAQRVGAQAKIIVHPGVSSERRNAIAAFGADVIEVSGTYDDSVEAAVQMASKNGWVLVADTSSDANDPTPLLVMHGYTVMAREILDQWHEMPPTHVFIQVGVGGLAASVVAEAVRAWSDAPRFVSVEPETVDCLFQSMLAGFERSAVGDLTTIMAGLSCGEVSLAAWKVLRHAISDALKITDDLAVDAMRRLYFPAAGDEPIESGESGGVGLAGLIYSCSQPDIRRALGLSPESRVLLINSEGATDPVLFQKLVHHAAGDIGE